MLTRCEQKIMEVVLPQPFKTHSVKHISRLIKTSYALTYESMQSLIRKKMVKADKIGHSLACQADLSADPRLLAVSSLEHSRRFLDKAPFGFVIDDIRNKLNDLMYILLLFGSHAKGTAAKDSDRDLLCVVQNEADIERTKKRLQSVVSSTNIKIEFDVITTAWLVKMFEEKHTVGREVLEGTLVLHGAEQYYTLVNAYDNTRGH